jgi:hypothetical protein
MSYEIGSFENFDYEFFNGELEEMGLYSQIKAAENNLTPLPKFTYVGEYKYDDKEELKNLLYTEVKKLFHSHGMNVTLFIGVAENVTLGIESF